MLDELLQAEGLEPLDRPACLRCLAGRAHPRCTAPSWLADSTAWTGRGALQVVTLTLPRLPAGNLPPEVATRPRGVGARVHHEAGRRTLVLWARDAGRSLRRKLERPAEQSEHTATS